MQRINKVAVIGMGYVGLPLAIEFGKYFETLGFDIKKSRINELNKNYDCNCEIRKSNFFESKKLKFSFEELALSKFNTFIIAVPTPINKSKEPDLTLIINATKLVGKYLKSGDIVVYESTVYPGLTEEICIPILKRISGIDLFNEKNKINKYFHCGYSPERINPGDKKNNIKSITKIVSGSCLKSRNLIADVYKKIIKNIYLADSIKIAEAAKVIENTQRDINIAFINELSEIFDKLNINFKKVLEAARTKWNFIDFRPGLVGGHCIGVDPYYLSHKLKLVGYKTKLILQGRKINDSMSLSFSKKLLRHLRKKKNKKKYNILILGVTFKENVKDIRNSKVFEMINYLSKKNNVKFFDPIIDCNYLPNQYKFFYIKKIKKNYFDGIVLAVSHRIFLKKTFQMQINLLSKKQSIIFDIKQKLSNKIIKKTIISS